MTQDAKEQPVKQGKTILLYTGNIMMDGARAGFLNTSMGKNNAELVNSLRHIKSVEGDDERQWRWTSDEVIRLQNPDTQDELLNSETARDEFDITVKLFFLPGARDDVDSRTRYAKEALDAVSGALGIDKFDTLILSLPNIVLEKDEEDYNSKEFPVPEKTVQSWVETWKIFEDMYHEGQVSTLGVSEFGILRLQAFLPHVNVPPAIDQINLRDCCDVPHDLLEFAKQEGIKLMPHMDEDNPLPNETLQEVLCDLGVSEKVVDMRWVVKYTAIVEERGVVDNKGYIVSASTA